MGRGRRWKDVPGDPGLQRSELRSRRGPYVGAPARRPIRRFAHDRELDRLLLGLYRGFGAQRWWPAQTPFEVMVGAILTQNTAWSNVERALARLEEGAPLSPARLLRMAPEDLEECVRPSGYFRAKARKLLELSRWYLESGGLAALRERPLAGAREELLAVWGVGPETADSILCYAAGRRSAIVDTYTRRVLGRHGLVDAELTYEDLRSWLMERLVASQPVYEEFHALFVRAGYDHCKPKARCAGCPGEPLL